MVLDGRHSTVVIKGREMMKRKSLTEGIVIKDGWLEKKSSSG
jgi:hypothetical protein